MNDEKFKYWLLAILAFMAATHILFQIQTNRNLQDIAYNLGQRSCIAGKQ